MKFIYIAVLASAFSLNAFAKSPVCTALEAEGAAPAKVYTVEKSDPKKVPALNPTEMYMVQMAVMFSGNQALTPAQAAKEFFDVKYDSQAGSIRYMSIETAAGKKAEVAYVTYYPGDNEYGLVFKIRRDKTTREVVSAYQLATIGDGDFSCTNEN